MAEAVGAIVALTKADTDDEEVQAEPQSNSDLDKALMLLILLWRRKAGAAAEEITVVAGNPATGEAQHIDGDSVDAFGDFMRGLMVDLYTQAAYTGRLMAGVTGPLGEADQIFGASIAAEQEARLQNFLADIRNGRYTNPDGSLRLKAIQQRANMYVDRAGGVVNEAFVRALPATQTIEVDGGYEIVSVLIIWHCMEDATSCSECPEIAEGGPYSAETMPAYPGVGVQCGPNCRCWLETTTGIVGFQWNETEGE